MVYSDCLSYLKLFYIWTCSNFLFHRFACSTEYMRLYCTNTSYVGTSLGDWVAILVRQEENILSAGTIFYRKEVWSLLTTLDRLCLSFRPCNTQKHSSAQQQKHCLVLCKDITPTSSVPKSKILYRLSFPYKFPQIFQLLLDMLGIALLLTIY